DRSPAEEPEQRRRGDQETERDVRGCELVSARAPDESGTSEDEHEQAVVEREDPRHAAGLAVETLAGPVVRGVAKRPEQRRQRELQDAQRRQRPRRGHAIADRLGAAGVGLVTERWNDLDAAHQKTADQDQRRGLPLAAPDEV